MKEFIKNKLKKLNIRDEKIIDEYIDFCFKHHTKKVKFKTVIHHILPKANNLPFNDCGDLRKNKWNGVTLTHKNHYKAHYLLTLAFDEPSILCAFCAMNEKDLKNKRLAESDLIGAKEYNSIVERKNKELSKLRLSEKWKETVGKDAIEKMKNSFDYEASAKKRLKTINTIKWQEKHKNMWKNIAKQNDYETIGRKISKTKNSKEWKETIGKDAVKKRIKKMDYKAVGEKQSETKNSKEWKETVGKNAINKLSKSRRKMFPKYNVFDRNDNLIYENIDQVDLRKISFVLERKTKENRMGATRQSKIELNKKHNLHLIGWYTEKVKE